MKFFLADTLDIDNLQTPPGDLGVTFAKMMFTFLLLIVLLIGTYWVIKRMIRFKLQSSGTAPSIHLIEKKMISPKTMIYLVEVDNKKILLAESQLEIKRLESFEIKDL